LTLKKKKIGEAMDMALDPKASDDFYEDPDFSSSLKELENGGASFRPPERVRVEYKPTWASYDKEVIKLPVVGRHVGQR
jgi:hypothetical protein